MNRCGSERGKTPPLDGIRVLVVDDEAAVLEVLADVLEEHGAQVSAASSAPEALETFIRNPPDIMLADVSMPVHDGYWLIRQIRALPVTEGGKRPAAAVTGYVAPDQRTTVLRAGFDDYVPKPIDAQRLVDVVLRLVRSATT